MSKADLPFIQSKRFRWIVLLLIASVPLLGWWAYGLFDLDEGFYAAVTGSMIRHKEWITPLYSGKPWFEKPILIYWLAKPSIMLFGQEIGPRLPSVLCTIATYALVAWFVRRRISPMAAVMSPFILGSSLLVVVVGRMMMTDAPLLFFFTAAMLTYWESLIGDQRWKLVTAACLGFGVLAKGPVAIILFVGILIVYWFVNRPHQVKGLHPTKHNEVRVWLIGALILFAIVATWYVPAYLANGQTFVHEFLIKQNVGRFEGGDAAHTLPLWKSFWFYIPILLIGMFPWILWLPKAWPSKAKSEQEVSSRDPSAMPQDDTHSLKIFLATWTAVVFVFFTLAGAKLPHYILPACPPIAILVGWYFAKSWEGLSRKQIQPKLLMTVGWLIATWIVAQVGFEYWYVKSGQAEAHGLVQSVLEADDSMDYGFIVYQLSRRNKDLGTGKPELQETTLPSLSFYVGDDIIETDALSPYMVTGQYDYVFTRTGRIRAGNMPGLKFIQASKHFEIFAYFPQKR